MSKFIAALCLACLTPAAQASDLLGLEAMLGDSERSPVPRGWTVGGAAYSGTSPYKDGSASTMAIPGGIYIGKDFMFLGDRAFYTFARQGGLQYYGRVRLRLGNLDPKDNPQWAGLDKRKGQLEAGLGLGLISDVGLWTARTSSDVSGRSKGSELLFNWSAPLVRENWMVMPGLGAMWRQDKLANYYFGGVSEAEAAPGRPAYNVGHAWSFIPSLVASYRINPQCLVGGALSADVFSDAIRNSPLVQQRARYNVLFGVGYVWR